MSTLPERKSVDLVIGEVGLKTRARWFMAGAVDVGAVSTDIAARPIDIALISVALETIAVGFVVKGIDIHPRLVAPTWGATSFGMWCLGVTLLCQYERYGPNVRGPNVRGCGVEIQRVNSGSDYLGWLVLDFLLDMNSVLSWLGYHL